MNHTFAPQGIVSVARHFLDKGHKIWKILDTGDFVGLPQKHGEVVLSLTCLRTILPNGNLPHLTYLQENWD